MFNRRLGLALIVAVLIALVFTITRCNMPTERTDAYSNAASVAIGTIENRTVTERDIERATAVAQMEIANATDPDAVRAAVLAGVCGSSAHRNDPACALR